MLKKKIEKLIGLIENTEIEEIEVSSFWGAQKIRLSKSKGGDSEIGLLKKEKEKSVDLPVKNKLDQPDSQTGGGVKSIPIDETVVEEDDYEDETRFKIIPAPLVGTFYASPKPEDPVFVDIGEDIKTGKVVCIIEAMKIFNEIESEFDGKLVHVYVKDGTPVEYGQELFVLRISDV